MKYSISMLTDLYQLTMAQGYWKLGKHQERAMFDLFFREHPFQGGYTLFCGLESVLRFIPTFKFTERDIDYLATLKDANAKPLFERAFLKALLELELTVNIDAVKEGTVVFPKEPLIRVEGALWECQLLETMLLNLINFPTLIATKAARICHAAAGEPIIEFGLRRAQGPDGGLTASRAAYIGGVVASSNVLAGQAFGIPVVGTHAHSWVMAFDEEITALRSYAEIMPDNCILLVDTYRTLQGIQSAIQVGLELKAKGQRLLGIRLDSGDLASLSKTARELLDEAGLTQTEIIGSKDLDEYTIADLKKRGAKISCWGVGTRLVTAYDQPALGGVYKLIALQDNSGKWKNKAKQTEDVEKQTLLGIYKVRRFYQNAFYVQDVMINTNSEKLSAKEELNSSFQEFEDLLIPIFRQGKPIYQSPSINEIRQFALEQLQKFPEDIKKLKSPTQYPVLLSDGK